MFCSFSVIAYDCICWRSATISENGLSVLPKPDCCPVEPLLSVLMSESGSHNGAKYTSVAIAPVCLCENYAFLLFGTKEKFVI